MHPDAERVIALEEHERQWNSDFRRSALTVLNYVADHTYIGTDAEWHFKPGYDPQLVLDILRVSRMNHFARAVDNLDAAVFIGDGLFDVENRDLFRQSMERWQRKLIEWEEIAAEVAADDTDSKTGGDEPFSAETV